MKKTLGLLFLSSQLFAQSPSFQAKALYFLSDGDMSASSFFYNEVRNESPRRDLLTSLQLPITQLNSRQPRSVVVSNSLMQNAQLMALSAGKSLLYVAESAGNAKPELGSLDYGLRRGQFITTLSTSDIQNPIPTFKFQVGNSPLAIDLNKTEEYLAVTCDDYGNELIVYELDESGKPLRKIKKPIGMPEGKITGIKWHENNEFLVYTNESTRQVGLIKVVRDGPTQKIVRLQLHGNPVTLSGTPGNGDFSKDGRYFILPVLKKKKTATYTNEKSELYIVKLNYEETGSHYLLSKVEVGENLESMALHPLGNIVATLHLNHSFYPVERTSETAYAFVTLYTLSDDGTLTQTSRFRVDGTYCSGLAFDAKGENLAIGITEYANYGIQIGGIEFMKVIMGSKPSLEMQPIKLILPSGLHNLFVIP